MVRRHWRYYERACVDKTIGISRVDTVCWFPDGIEQFPIGKDEYVNGDNLCRRLIATYEKMIGFDGFNKFVIIEPDTIFFRPLDFSEGIAAYRAGYRQPGFKAGTYWHNPWCADRYMAKLIVSTGYNLIRDNEIERGFPDQFFGRIIETIGCECQPIPGYSKNTIENEKEAADAANACLKGGAFIHGVKRKETLDFIESVWAKHSEND